MRKLLLGCAWCSVVVGILQIGDGLANVAIEQPGCVATAFGVCELGWAFVSAGIATLLLLSGPRRIVWWPLSFVAYSGVALVHGLVIAIAHGPDAVAANIPDWVWVAGIVFGAYFAAASAISLGILRSHYHLRSPETTS